MDEWKDGQMDREMEGRKKERGRKRKEERKGGMGEGNKTQLVTLEKKSMGNKLYNKNLQCMSEQMLSRMEIENPDSFPGTLL